jgi:hypothetical protein
MKKLMTTLSLMLFGVVLVGCEFADGVDDDFGNKAVSIFVEIDDDTMTMEMSDADDVSNFDLLTVEADTKREVNAVKALEGMLKLQDKVIKRDREALKEYMTARQAFLKAVLDNTEQQHRYEHDIPDFEFYEED